MERGRYATGTTTIRRSHLGYRARAALPGGVLSTIPHPATRDNLWQRHDNSRRKP